MAVVLFEDIIVADIIHAKTSYHKRSPLIINADDFIKHREFCKLNGLGNVVANHLTVNDFCRYVNVRPNFFTPLLDNHTYTVNVDKLYTENGELDLSPLLTVGTYDSFILNAFRIPRKKVWVTT